MATITKEIASDLVSRFGETGTDTGNPRVQVALLTHRIQQLTEHVKQHRKDAHSRRGLLLMVSKRRRLLGYLKNNQLSEYRRLIADLGIRG